MKQIAFVALSLLLLTGAAPNAPVTIAELTDSAGDVQPGSTSDGPRAPLDVVRITLTSDGRNILVVATLKDPPGSFASSAVTLYFDTDNKPSTGVETFWGKKNGFEFVSELDACIHYTDGSSVCSGGMNGKVKSHYAVADVSKYGGSSMETESIRSVFRATETPVEGKILRASIAYADLGVKSGAVVRIVARESDGPYDATADFPDVLLKLK